MPLADYEAEVFVEVGAWKDYDDLEEHITLDELFLTFEKIMEKQKRQLETMYGPLGGGGSSSGKSGSGLDRAAFDNMQDINVVAQRLNAQDVDLSYAKDNDIMDYVGGPITAGGETLFGYTRADEQTSEK